MIMQEAAAAEAGLNDLLVRLINEPVGERVSREAGTVRVKVDTAVDEIRKSVARGVSEIKNDSADKLSEVGDGVNRELRRLSRELAEQVVPSIADIARLQDVAAQEQCKVFEAIAEARAESHASAKNGETSFDRLTVQHDELNARMGRHFDSFTVFVDDAKLHRARADTRLSSIEASIVEHAGNMDTRIGDGIRACERQVEQLLNRVEAMDARSIARVDKLDEDLCVRGDRLNDKLDEQSGTLRSRMEACVAALAHQNEEHRAATQSAQAALAASIVEIGLRQSKVMRLAYGSLGVSLVAALLLIAEVMKSVGH
ncbi:hypothetical protein CR51_31185 [Caballeronia megalochromosomata]|nr:hypothetical protein CR51_31185 [Caballeronia megalochromosomata]